MAIFFLSGSLTYSAEDYFLLCFGSEKLWTTAGSSQQTTSLLLSLKTDRARLIYVFFFFVYLFVFKYQFAVYMNTPGSTILESAALRSLNIDGLYPTWLRMT